MKKSGFFCIITSKKYFIFSPIINKTIPQISSSILWCEKNSVLHTDKSGTHFCQVTQFAKPLEAIGSFKLQLLP
jgi:hypothetical protein